MTIPSRWPFRGIGTALGHIIAMLQQILKGLEKIMLSQQDLLDKANAAKAANDTLIAMAKEQAGLLRTAIANSDQAAMQAVADVLDGVAAADAAEVAADTVPAAGA